VLPPQAERQQAAALQQSLAEERHQLRLVRSVSERARAEASEEHGAVLEAQAAADLLREQLGALQREKEVLLSRAEAVR
jgi:DNA repair protein RadC